MHRRKLQVFISSTYEDLIDERLAAMEAVLASGHIPAAMEQFSAGDDTAWERIRLWIDESDAFILILGGRYGSIEPISGKSYVQLEYEYAIDKNKPFFALVITETHHEARVHELGLRVDERVKQTEYSEFKRHLTERLCRFWSDTKDIQRAVFQKLPEWAARQDLAGWIRADEAPSAATANELARLSEENRELRQLTARTEDFYGLSFEEMVRLLRNLDYSVGVADEDIAIRDMEILPPISNMGVLFDQVYVINGPGPAKLEKKVPEHRTEATMYLLQQMAHHRLVQQADDGGYALTDVGLAFRNRLALAGDWKYRRSAFWGIEDGQNEVSGADL